MKNVEESERFLVGWGRDGDKITFFITHGELPETKDNPVVCNPEDLPRRIVEMADEIDRSRDKI